MKDNMIVTGLVVFLAACFGVACYFSGQITAENRQQKLEAELPYAVSVNSDGEYTIASRYDETAPQLEFSSADTAYATCKFGQHVSFYENFGAGKLHVDCVANPLPKKN